jgi:hypothetical protein
MFRSQREFDAAMARFRTYGRSAQSPEINFKIIRKKIERAAKHEDIPTRIRSPSAEAEGLQLRSSIADILIAHVHFDVLSFLIQ